MTKERVIVNDRGIKNRLKTIKPFGAISEYIWNGFDAKADQVEIKWSSNDLGTLDYLSIRDNGTGIPEHKLDLKFKPFLSSEKRNSTDLKHVNLVHGKNGLGRLTFFKFANKATWDTTYLNDDGFLYDFSITINSDSLDNFSKIDSSLSNSNYSGTNVIFTDIIELSDFYIKNTLLPYIEKEFSWFLYLFKESGHSLKLGNESIDPKNLIKDQETFEITIEDYSFNIEYIRWESKLNSQSSRFYFSNQNGDFCHSETTQLNNKSDSFYHSVYVKGTYFNNFITNDEQADLYSNSTGSEIYKKLISELNGFLRTKRKPFLIEYAKNLVEEYEERGIFPTFNYNNKWEKMKADDLREAIQELYKIEPKFFKDLNKPQQKILVRMLSLIIDGGEVESFFNIVDSVISLSSEEKERFAEQLKVTQLSSILKTIELLADRYKAVAEFEKLVYEPEMYAGEVPHLQKMMERNYWLLGEQYQLVTAEEPDFNEAARRHTYILHGEKLKKHKVGHVSEQKEMDLFMIRQRMNENKIEHIVVELKHPVNVRLGKKEIDQVYEYYQVIRSESLFNASNMTWKFYLIGNKYDSTGYIEHIMDVYKGKGDYGLVYKGEYEVYVRTWSEVFSEFKIKHDFLNQKLQIEKDKIQAGLYVNADELVNNHRTSDSPAQFYWAPTQ